MKYTAHEFRKLLHNEGKEQLINYETKATNKKHEFWQRDSLAVHLPNQAIAFQKLEYIHTNPLAEHWQLVQDPSDYKYSSAAYYEKGNCEFEFLKDLREVF